MLTPTQAAKKAKVGKAAILRAIKSGKLPAQRQENGAYSIDPAELDRVYAPSPLASSKQSGAQDSGHATLPVLQAEPAEVQALQATPEPPLSELKAGRDAPKSDGDALHKQAEPSLLAAPASPPSPFLPDGLRDSPSNEMLFKSILSLAELGLFPLHIFSSFLEGYSSSRASHWPRIAKSKKP